MSWQATPASRRRGCCAVGVAFGLLTEFAFVFPRVEDAQDGKRTEQGYKHNQRFHLLTPQRGSMMLESTDYQTRHQQAQDSNRLGRGSTGRLR